jgi:predicted porin
MATSRYPLGTLCKFSNERASDLALAALASTAAFAQSSVTLSGAIGAGFNKTSSGTKLDKTDAKVNFAAVEDLGGGMKVSANFDLITDARSTGTQATSENMLIALEGGFGKVEFKQVAAASTMLGGLESLPTDINAVMGGDTMLQAWGYTLPSLVKNVTLSVGGFQKADGAFGGISTSGMFQDAGYMAYTVAYADGPLSASYSYRTTDKRSRYIAGYDFGVAKVQAGTDTNKQTEIVLTAPVGAVTLGLHWAKDTNGNSSGTVAAGDHGTAVSAVYNLSKTTNINLSVGNTSDGNTSRLKLTKTF